MYMIKEVRHIGISVTDMNKSLKFYKDLLGFKIEREMNESGIHIDSMLSLDNVKVNTVKLSISETNNTLIELLQFISHSKYFWKIRYYKNWNFSFCINCK